MLALILPLTTGCQTGVKHWFYLGKEKPDQEHYRQAVSEIDYPDVVQSSPRGIEETTPPRTIASQEKDEIWDMSLEEAIHLALCNTDVIRSSGQFLSPNNVLLTNGNAVNTIYDPAIQASGVLFGGVGTEAALAAFDTNWTNTLFFGNNQAVQNTPFGGGVSGGVLETNTANFRTALSKQMAYGGQFTLSHDMNYLDSNSPASLFASTYTGNVQAEYRHQLLAGAGPEFVRVAGPLSPQFASIAGVGNGVLIARINQDISITDFEANIRNLVKEVEDTYWDLYLSYRVFDTAVTARNAALHTWRNANAKKGIGGAQGFQLQDEAQSRDRYFETRAQVENSLGDLYTTEQRLRSLMGIAVNDRKIIRPADTPVAAKIQADWYHSLAEALTERVELRRQKWNVKSLELQLGAAKNFARPRLDMIARYRVNGFGDNLLAYDDTDRFGGDLNSAYERMAQGNETGWDLGVELSMPIGLRLAKTQVQNLELRLTKARKVLSAQELEVGHELAVAFQELERSYATAVSNYSRRQAAMDRYRIESTLVEGGTGSVDLNLRAQESLATAAVAYHQSLVDYNKAIVNLNFRKGTLLREDNILLAEGRWEPEAYKQAFAHAKARANAIPAPHLRTLPPAFAADGQIPSVVFTAPEAANMNTEASIMPMPEELPLPLPRDEAIIDPQTLEKSQPKSSSVPSVPAAGMQKNAPALDAVPSSPAYFENSNGKNSSSLPMLTPPPAGNETSQLRFSAPEAPEAIQATHTSAFQEVPAWANASQLKEQGSGVPPTPPAQAVRPAATPSPNGIQPAVQEVPEHDGWQLRKEGWGLNETPFTTEPVKPVSHWQQQPAEAPATSRTTPAANDNKPGRVALQIGSNIPEYRK